MSDFMKSKTKENLMRAFAGESQARNRYTFAAEQAGKSNLQVIESVFKFTAKQEEAHAKVYYSYLKEHAGQNITVDGNYPVDIYDDVLKLLRSAQHNEFQEYEHDYAAFSDIAKEEGFNQISNTFSMIANIEKTHGERFGYYAELLEQEKLFISDMECCWMCLNCGYKFNGTKAPGKCPVCLHDRGFFIRLEFAPFTASKF